MRIGWRTAMACGMALLGCGGDDGAGDADIAPDGSDAPSEIGAEEGDADADRDEGDDDGGVDEGVDDGVDEGVDDGGGGDWSVTVMGGVLPTGLGGITAVAAGSVAYVFGGVNGPPPAAVVDTILRYDPVDDRVTTLPVRLPQPTFLAAAAWNGTDAYLFGGFAGTDLTDAILRFDPAGPSVTVMVARLPAAVARTAAAEDGASFVVFGGSTGGFRPTGFVATITRYDPVTDAVTPSAASLPSARASRIGAIHCNGRILFFGGWGSSGKFDAILEYHAGTDTLEALAATLPVAQDGGALACDGVRVYLFGGESTVTLDHIVVFDTTDDSVVVAPVTLPTPRKGHAAVWLGDSAYVFGGQQDSGLTSQIVRVTPP